MHGSRDISLQRALRSGRVGPGRSMWKIPLVDGELARPSASLVIMLSSIKHCNHVIISDNLLKLYWFSHHRLVYKEYVSTKLKLSSDLQIVFKIDMVA